MADSQSAGEKTEEATPRKRTEARKKGTVARSTDLNGALALLGCSLLLPPAVQTVSAGLIDSFQRTIATPPTDISVPSVIRYLLAWLTPAAAALLPLLGGLMIIGLATNFAQVGFVMSGESMKPSFEKINPFQGFKRLLSRRQAVEGLKALFKLALFSWIVTAAIQSDWEKIMSLQFMPTNLVIATSGQILHSILVRVAVVWLVLAGLDYFFQRKEVDRQLRMTKDELRREMKEQEGSPEIKMAQMQRRRKILRGSMAKKIREADVLITNPTHYAIAIRYERSKDFAPIVLAKGVDYLALRMREIAQDGDVPIVENKPLARSLYAQCEPGDPIPRDLFGPVAEILAYVYKTAKKSKRAA